MPPLQAPLVLQKDSWKKAASWNQQRVSTIIDQPGADTKLLMHYWRLPETLMNALRTNIDQPASPADKRWYGKGLELQLLDYGLPPGPVATVGIKG